MKVVFWTREERGRLVESDWRETNLARAIRQGADKGDTVEIRITPDDGSIEVIDCDLVCKAGVKSRHWFTAYAEAGIPWLYFDKGYIRERADDQWLNYWRMSVNSHHPIAFLASAKKDRARADTMGTAFKFSPWRMGGNRGESIVVDGGSEKNFKFNGIIPDDAPSSEVDHHCERLIFKIKSMTDRPVIYRPKPSSPGREAIEGTEFARNRDGVHKKDYSYDLNRAWTVVTYNGAICYDANRMGIPSIVLGSGPARPICSTSLDDIEHPHLASDAERQQWLNNLAWCQFGMKELRDGTAWEIVKEMLAVTPIATPAEACPCSPL